MSIEVGAIHTFSINRLPKRPPIIFGDGFVLDGAAEFSGLIPHYEQADTTDAENMLRIREHGHDLQQSQALA